MSKSVVRISVKNKNNNNFRTLQIFKNKVNDEGIIQDLKKKEYYVKPSMRKRLKKKMQKNKEQKI